VKKGQNGRKSLRRLKPTVGCNVNKRRRMCERENKYLNNTKIYFRLQILTILQ
jgi:hypothetical protein